MSSSDPQQPGHECVLDDPRPNSDPVSARPAARAASRVSRASLLLGGLGLASAIFLVARLFASWRVTSAAASHQISIFGQRLSYPTANADAIVIVLLAVLGSVVTFRAFRGAARELTASRRLHQRLARERPQPLRGAFVIVDPQPRAFCAGLLRPRVYVTTGTLAILDEAALNAVLDHERHHARRHDPMRLAAGRVLARALFFLPQLTQLVEQHQALAELSADESAVNVAQANRSGLARAMLSFSDDSDSADAVGIASARVDYLLGDPPRWRFPALLCVATAVIIAFLTTVAVLIGQLADGSATLAPPFLSRQPCVVVLAAIPAILGILATFQVRRIRAPVSGFQRSALLE